MATLNNNFSAKNIAIIAHLSIFGWVFALIKHREKPDPFTAFYIRQALGINLLGLASMFINKFLGGFGTPSSSIIAMAGFVFWIISMVGAASEKESLIPILGDYFQDWFKSI